MAAVSVSFPANPNAQIIETEIAGMKGRVVDVTFSASFGATGDTLTAAALGWTTVFGFIPLSGVAGPAGLATAKPVGVSVDAAQSTLSFFLYNENDAVAYAQRPALAQAQTASNNATFVVRGIVLGS